MLNPRRPASVAWPFWQASLFMVVVIVATKALLTVAMPVFGLHGLTSKISNIAVLAVLSALVIYVVVIRPLRRAVRAAAAELVRHEEASPQPQRDVTVWRRAATE